MQLFYVVVALLGNLVIDIVYGLVDPRVQWTSKGKSMSNKKNSSAKRWLGRLFFGGSKGLPMISRPSAQPKRRRRDCQPVKQIVRGFMEPAAVVPLVVIVFPAGLHRPALHDDLTLTPIPEVTQANLPPTMSMLPSRPS